MYYDNNNLSESPKNLIETNRSKVFFKKRVGCPVCAIKSGDKQLDYKNPDFIVRFVSEGGRILASRITNVCARHQRHIKKAVKHSRVLALLPFIYKLK